MRFLQLLLLLLTGFVALGQTNGPIRRHLSLEDSIALALQHNLDIQIRQFNPEIARFNLGAVYGAYDPAFSASAEHDYNQSPGGFDPQGRPFGGTETETDSLRSALSGMLPWGLNYNLGVSLSDTYGTRPTIGSTVTGSELVTNTFFDLQSQQTVQFLSTNLVSTPISIREPFENTSGSLGFFQLRQPLLRNFWIDSTRLQILLDKKNVQISELDLRNQIMVTVTAVEQEYYNLVFAQDNVAVQQKALELAERLLAENKKRVEVGALAPLDEKQAEAQVANSRADLLAAQGTEDTQQRRLKSLLSDNYEDWKNVYIEPTASLFALPQQFNLQESWQRGLAMRPDLLQQRLNVEKQGYVVRYQRNQVYPQLDLVGTYGYNASSDEFSGALGQFTDRQNPFWSYGAQLSIPLTQKTARNNLRAAKATKEQIELELKQLEQNVLIQIENSIATAQTSFQRVDATRQARLYAEAALDAEQKKLESGKSTSFIVLQLQRDLTAARSSEIRALADYNIALAQVALTQGTTLEQRHIGLEVK